MRRKKFGNLDTRFGMCTNRSKEDASNKPGNNALAALQSKTRHRPKQKKPSPP
jgi:hypothetical protein